MKTIAQKSVAAVRKANKQWRISLCSAPMMELIRCMELNNSNVSACRAAITEMSKCMAGKSFQTGYKTDHPYSDPALLNELLRRAH